LFLLPQLASGQAAWVSDQFEITLRTGPSTSNAIERMLGSGTRLEVLEQDAEAGYSRVRTDAGTEGWVLTRYLMSEPSAREQLQALTGQLSDAASDGASLESQLAGVRGEFNSAQLRIGELEREKETLERELAEIRRTAADTLGVNQRNQSLRQELSDAGIRIDTLEHENRGLRSQTRHYWIGMGAASVLLGVILGLWLPRIRVQKRRYDRF
jgi:SH3 domain protein